MTTAHNHPAGPAQLNALAALAQRELGAGRLAEAADAYRRILVARPDIAEVHNNLAVILGRQRQLDEAIVHLRQALALRPGQADAHNNLAVALWQQNKTGEAAAHLRQALTLRPDYAEAQSNLGGVLTRERRYDEARQWIERALASHPGYAQAHNNLGNLLLDQGKFDEAAAHFERALALWPDYAEARSNLGSVLAGQGRFDAAVACFEQALARSLDFAEPHVNWGSLLATHGQMDEAAAHYRRALALRPDLAEAELGLAACLLVQGDFAHGLPAYEARLRTYDAPRFPSLPRWLGEPLTGRRLLLVGEQGFGDTIQMLRYARLLKDRGAYVILAVRAALGPLLASHPDIDELHLVGSAGEMPAADFYLPLLSAPLALGTQVATIPADIPYLFADQALADHWRQELAAIEGFKIGIAWQGSPTYKADRWRSIPLAEFALLAPLSGVKLISLQKGFGSEQIAAAGFPILDLSDRLDEAAGPLVETAAVIANLDLVVTPDTAIGHLAGALGTSFFVALHVGSDWRWLRDRDDSPWYPTARVFRQTTLGQWSDVFERIAQAVPQLAGTKGESR